MRRLPGDDYEPSVFLCENYPGVLGASEPLFGLHDRFLDESLRLTEDCRRDYGCPPCVGPRGKGAKGKEVARAILAAIAAP